MAKFAIRRVLLIPWILILVNFMGFSFAHITFQLQQSQSVYGSGEEGITPVWPEYHNYLKGVLRGDFGKMPIGVNEPVSRSILIASQSSLGLIALAFGFSIFLGLMIGLAAVRSDPPRTMHWLTLVATVGLAMPSFFVGTLLISSILFGVIHVKGEAILPVAGFGWDSHLILPVLALVIRPTMQIAQMTANLLSSELGKQYVIAARSFGHTWRSIRWDKALRNVLASIVLTIAGSFRLLMAELILVEWLFNWPGIGRLLVQTLVPPNLSGPGGLLDSSAFFLNPPLVAGLLVVFSFLFLVADMLASGVAQFIDPRLRVAEEEMAHD